MARQNTKPDVKRGKGGKWLKGVSPNPGGLPHDVRERRKRIAELLDKAFALPDGSDLLVDAIVDGVAERDSTCLKLACSYRWGSPEQFVQLYGENGGPLSVRATDLTDDELAAIAAKALPKKAGGTP